MPPSQQQQVLCAWRLKHLALIKAQHRQSRCRHEQVYGATMPWGWCILLLGKLSQHCPAWDASGSVQPPVTHLKGRLPTVVSGASHSFPRTSKVGRSAARRGTSRPWAESSVPLQRAQKCMAVHK